jgi:putative tricarboxylic transport membrane protein
MEYHLINIYQAFIYVITNPLNMGVLILASFIGLLAGAAPGITSVAITAILLPFTIWLPPETAIIALVAAYAQRFTAVLSQQYSSESQVVLRIL